MFWQPPKRMPYNLLQTLANNKDLQQDDLANIAHGITNRTLLGATDGTEHEGKMAGGWSLYDPHRKKLITGSTTIPGNPNSSNSTQPEHGIQISILHAIILSAQTYNIKSKQSDTHTKS